MEKQQETRIERRSTSMPAEMIEKAIAGNADLDKLEKLLELQMRWEANEARKAYVEAMSNFKAVAVNVTKDSKVDFVGKTGVRTNYKYATLHDITSKITPALSAHGLAVTWTTNQTERICVTCKITHTLGHSEQTTLCAEPDMSGNKNSIQAIGSTITYLERYTLLALCGLATTDQDDDAQSAEKTYITIEQLEEIKALLIETKSDHAKFAKFMGVEFPDEIQAKDYTKAIEALKAKRGTK